MNQWGGKNNVRVEYRVTTPAKSIISVDNVNNGHSHDDDHISDKLVAKFEDGEISELCCWSERISWMMNFQMFIVNGFEVELFLKLYTGTGVRQ